jgi:hypothetical protein
MLENGLYPSDFGFWFWRVMECSASGWWPQVMGKGLSLQFREQGSAGNEEVRRAADTEIHMKIVFIILGVLLGLFAVAQLLQLLGLFGAGPSLPGVAFTLLGGALSFACFKKAMGPAK